MCWVEFLAIIVIDQKLCQCVSSVDGADPAPAPAPAPDTLAGAGAARGRAAKPARSSTSSKERYRRGKIFKYWQLIN